MKFSFLLPLAALLLVLGGTARAERADSQKPMQVEADRMQHDDPRQLTVLTGHVQAIKGTLVMRAARMEVQQDGQGQQVARFWAEVGERVFFRQKREGVDEFIEGESEQAVYDSRQDLMTLTGRAEVRILREGRAADQLYGQRIVYNNSTEVLNVDGQPQGASGARQRVRAVLAPKAEASAAAPSRPALRSSPTTGGKP
jgi:lipopolysaccharide export system protein LptA